MSFLYVARKKSIRPKPNQRSCARSVDLRILLMYVLGSTLTSRALPPKHKREILNHPCSGLTPSLFPFYRFQTSSTKPSRLWIFNNVNKAQRLYPNRARTPDSVSPPLPNTPFVFRYPSPTTIPSIMSQSRSLPECWGHRGVSRMLSVSPVCH